MRKYRFRRSLISAALALTVAVSSFSVSYADTAELAGLNTETEAAEEIAAEVGSSGEADAASAGSVTVSAGEESPEAAGEVGEAASAESETAASEGESPAAASAETETAAATGETEAASEETSSAAGETEAVTEETSAAAGETEAEADETASAGETEAEADETASAGETEAAAEETAVAGETETAAGETEAAASSENAQTEDRDEQDALAAAQEAAAEYATATPSNLAKEELVVSPAQTKQPEEEIESGSFGIRSIDYTAPRLSRSSLSRLGASLESSYISEYTEAKSQGSFENCWAFAATNCEESSMVLNGETEPDYSEYALAYFMYHTVLDPLGLTEGDSNSVTDGTWLQGGSICLAAVNLLSWDGCAIDETDAPYEDLEDEYSEIDESVAYQNLAVPKKVLLYNAKDTEAIKQAIKDYGAVAISYYAVKGSTYLTEITEGDYSGDYAYFNYTNPSGTNHGVSIVGWDDDFPKEYFGTEESQQPAENGAWLVKNSWGTNWPSKTALHPGCFWISYEESSISGDIVAVEMTSAEDYDSNYHYDGTASPECQYIAANQSFGNVYQAHRNEKITAASFGLDSTNVPYSVQVYVSGEPMTESAIEGTPIFETPIQGETSVGGFYTVDFENPVFVSKGQYFSVVVTPETKCFAFIEKSAEYSGWYKVEAGIAEGQSFFTNGYGTWKDAAASDFCFRVKAYAKDVTIPAKYTEVLLADSDILVGEETTASATVYPVYYDQEGYDFVFESSDPSVATVDQNGTVTGVGNGSCEISYTSGSVTGSATISVHVNAEYKVEHYLQKTDGETYESTPEATDTFTDWAGNATEAEAKSYEGFEAQSFEQAVIAEDGSTVVKIYYNRISYTIDFDMNGYGSAPTAITALYEAEVSAPADPLEKGYTFGGWYTDTSYEEEKKYTFTTMPLGGITLYAKWTANQYTISFNANGHGTAPDAVTAAYESSITPPAEPAAGGYTFVGWYEDAACSGDLYAFKTMPAKDFTLYAKWIVTTDSRSMYRMYNENSGEHFYTASATERDNLVHVGWNYEGIAWTAPSISATPVYRLFNPNAKNTSGVTVGDHHYTTSAEEKDMLVGIGWQYEGIGWYSDGSVALLRLYNPNADAGSHHYTPSQTEKNNLVSLGWKYEGISWYGL